MALPGQQPGISCSFLREMEGGNSLSPLTVVALWGNPSFRERNRLRLVKITKRKRLCNDLSTLNVGISSAANFRLFAHGKVW